MNRIALTALCITFSLALTGCKDSSSDTAPQTDNGANTAITPPAAGNDSESRPSGKKERPPTAQLTASDLMKNRPPQNKTEDIKPLELKRVPYPFMDGRLTLDIPESFRPMTDKELDVKYAANSRPDIAYTAETTAINLTATHTNIPLQPLQIYEYHKSYEQQIKRLYPDSKWEKNAEVRVDDRSCWLSQFRNQVSDTEVYNMVLGTSLNNRLLLVTFTFPSSLSEDWVTLGDEIMMNAKFSGVGTGEESPPE